MTDEDRIYIGDAAARLRRKVDTLRKWDTSKVLPAELVPARGKKNMRYWTPDQFEQLEAWAAGRIPGSALPGYDPDPDRVAQHRENMRKPKGRGGSG